MTTFQRTFFAVAVTVLCLSCVPTNAGGDPALSRGGSPQRSDHFDGSLYFNAGEPLPPPERQTSQRSRMPWVWRWLFGAGWPEWPVFQESPPGPPPVERVSKGDLVVTPVGHATFLIQIDGMNILTDPIWSDRCSPVSWAGPQRHRPPGVRFEELPPVDAVLVSHNHYDHLDLPTLERLAEKGTPRAITPLGNAELIRESGIPAVEELDWWQSLSLSPEVRVTMTPAQHFSSRTLWDRNRALWGGFVISGPSGIVFFAGDTGYGPHFREIARRFPGTRVALLPISPFQPGMTGEPSEWRRGVHMGPAEALQAKLDLGAGVGIAGHFQVFQMGGEGFDDAVDELALAVKRLGLKPDAFVAPALGRAIAVGNRPKGNNSLAGLQCADVCP